MNTLDAIKEVLENNKEFKINFKGEQFVIKKCGPEIAIESTMYEQSGLVLENIEILQLEGWEEVKKPVTWKEAFQAGLEGKKIKVEGQFNTYKNYEDLIYAIKYLSIRPNYFKSLMETNWYIED